MPALRLPVLVAALAAAPALVAAWNPTCTGEFTCSVIRSDDSALWEYGDNGEAICKFGHIEEDGACERSCDGPRTAPCRCQTQSEAEMSIESGAKTSLFVCLAIVIIGLTTSLCAGVCLKRVSGAERSRAARQAEVREGQPQPETEDPAVAPAAGPASPDTEAQGTAAQAEGAPADGTAAEGEQQPDSPSSAASGVLPSRLEEVLSNTNRFAEEHPRKVQLMRWFFPCLALGFSAWGAYELLSRQDKYEGHFYDHLETFLGIIAVLAVFLSVMLLLCSSIDSNPLICLVRTLMVAYLVVPLIGVAGLVWSLIRMMNPDGIYHACERPHCIFDVC